MKSLIFIFFLIFPLFAKAQIVIVSNKNSDIKRLSKASIKYLYLAKVNKINGVKIKPLLSKDKQLHKIFVNTILDKNISQYASYWARLVFTGRTSIPRRLNNEDINKQLEILNTIIYMDKKNINKTWKIIYEE